MLNFYICNVCGNIVLKIQDSGNTPSCCNTMMTKLNPASTDGALEKHVPVIRYDGSASGGKAVHIDVGSEPHPSDKSHYIEWIVLETSTGIHLHHLNPGDTPHAVFILDEGEQALNAYSYCNLHGLWVS